MNREEMNLEWLWDPDVFAVNRMPAHSDHMFWLMEQDGDLVVKRDSRLMLDGEWKFCWSPNLKSRPVDFFRTDQDHSRWESILVPGHWQTQGYGQLQYTNSLYPWDGREEVKAPGIPEEENEIGSYVRWFSCPEFFRGKRIFLSFQGVETAFSLWINGFFVGYGEDSFTPSEFEVTDYLKEGENKLAVEVYQRSTASWLEDQDFWRFSGIFRSVYLYAVPETHVWDLNITAGLSRQYQDGEMEIKMDFLKQNRHPAQVEAILCHPDGSPVWRDRKETESDQEGWKVSIPNVLCWSAEYPWLYQLTITLWNEQGQCLEEVVHTVGFRSFELKDGIMLLNGKRIIFRGVNRHEFHPEKGRAIGEKEMLEDIQILKRCNFNAVRTSHYPNQSRWYQLCDQYGIYLIDEANLETHGSWALMDGIDEAGQIPGSKTEWKAAVLDRAQSMLQRDKNHPSVLIWSCGNESLAGEDILAMADYFRQQDPTRLVHYEGVSHARAFDAASDMESRMYLKPQGIRAYLESQPEKPYLSCEYMHAMGNSLGGMSLYTDLEDQYEKYQGGFIWDYIDQAMYQEREDGTRVLAYGGDFDDRSTDYVFCTDGILYADRRYSPKMAEVKALYAPLRILVEKDSFQVQNRNLFRPLRDYRFRVTWKMEDRLLMEKDYFIDALPGESIRQVLPPLPMKDPGNYVIRVSAFWREKPDWMPAGEEIAFGDHLIIISEPDFRKKPDLKAESEPFSSFRVITGDGNLSIRGNGWQAMFSLTEGGIISFRVQGREYITRTPRLSYWRALTDNDRGAGASFSHSQWLAAGMGQRHRYDLFQKEITDTEVTLSFAWESGSHPSFISRVIYRVDEKGTLHVTLEYPGAEGLPDLPVFALDWKLKKNQNHFTYFGRGPEENYIDRNQGCGYGVYRGTTENNLAGYLMPQETGNRTDVRWLSVTDEKGEGLCFRADEGFFQCSVLPYSAYELENAMHSYELPRKNYVWVRIAAAQRGVGGDDSWGAPVQEPYRISSRRPLRLSFSILPKTSGKSRL